MLSFEARGPGVRGIGGGGGGEGDAAGGGGEVEVVMVVAVGIFGGRRLWRGMGRRREEV